ncbi:MAG: DDE-type integrase/transposase/recombinase [Erysipelotrichaceae bacterium]|nr:DDE-type integrase/transposase/recombinase [Erysipelotrichaceae bacterium]
MDEDKRNKIALFRYGTIAPVILGQIENGLPWTYFRSVQEKEFEYIDGSFIRVSPATLDRWYKSYKKNGLDGLKPNGRSDLGSTRKLDCEIKKEIEYYVDEFPRLPAIQIYEKLKSHNLIVNGSPSLSTVNRFVQYYRSKVGKKNIIEKRRYEKEHINEVWYGDTTYGPYMLDVGIKKRIYIIALIDDASRMVVGCKAYFEDNFINLMDTIKSAVTKYGVPKLLSFDNGANYRSNQMNLLAARIGVAINYCPVKTPTSKAKIERWFKTLRDQFLSSIKSGDYKSLDDFNNDLLAYVQKYNSTVHSSLDGVCPIDRFFQESQLIIRKTDKEIERDFLIEVERRVSADSVVVIDEKEYEVDYHFQGQKILIRYTPDLKNVYVVDRSDRTLIPITLLDKQANSHIKREKIRLAEMEER